MEKKLKFDFTFVCYFHFINDIKDNICLIFTTLQLKVKQQKVAHNNIIAYR